MAPSVAPGSSDRQLRVLLAEDNASVRESVAEVLTDAGYAVIETEDGVAALNALIDQPVDVCLLDLRMPRGDGLWLLRHLAPVPPIVLMYSAFEYAKPEEIEKEIGARVFRYLWKPMSPDELLKAVAEAVAELETMEAAASAPPGAGA